jgi:microcystin-dependent protein
MYSIFKAFVLSLLMIAQVHFAYAQNAAILPPAKTTFLGPDGKPLTAGKVDFYIPGTTTRKTTWQDAAATIANTNPVVLDAAGRAIILGNGSYRQVVKDRNNNVIWDQVTSSAGAGGTSQSTVGDGLSVGSIIPWAGMVAPVNYAFAYGQELSRTTYESLKNAITLTQNITCVSGNATVISVSDTSQLNVGGAVEAACLPANSVIVSKTVNTVTLNNLASVSTTSSATFFPWGAGNGLTTFNAPDLRGRYLPGRNNMGGSASANLSSPYYVDPNSLGGGGGNQSKTLLASEMPSHSHTVTDPGHSHDQNMSAAGGAPQIVVANGSGVLSDSGINTSSNTTGITINATGGGIAVSGTVAAGGSGYTAGTQLLTLVGGTCTTQPQFNITTAAGAITAPMLVTAGDCSVVPSNPISTTGGGGTLGTLNVTWSARPISLIPPSRTINYVVKISPDISLSIANCENLLNSGTACIANTGTSGHTLPFLDGDNTWSGTNNFGTVNITGGSITGMPLPTVGSDVASKQYVDNVASGLNVLAQTKYATAAVLPNTPTYANGAAGVGATLTAGANSTLTVDGNVVALNEIVLVKNQASALENGIYTLTTAGSGAAAWVLTRATYFDQAAEMTAGSYTFITNGSTNSSSSYVLQTAVATVGTDPLNWVLFASSIAGVSQLDGVQGAITTQSGSLKVVGSQLSSNILASRAFAITQDLSAFTSIKTMGYATAGDGGSGSFVKIGGGTQFKDTFITAGSLTSPGITCPNGSYVGIPLVVGTGRGAYASLTVSGSVVTSVTLTAPGNQYEVGDVLTGGIGCGTDWQWTVSAVSTPLASFTDAAGNKWQYMVDAGSVIDPRSFGAKFDCTTIGLTCDASATDDFASIQAALYFANYHGSKTLNSDTPTGYSTRVKLPFGSAKVCVSGTAYNTLIVPDSVPLEGMAKFGSWLKQCDSDNAAHHFVTLGFPGKQLACFGPQLRYMGLYAGIGSANTDVSMIYTNCAQQGITINDVAVYSIFRMCLYATDGFGGASDFTSNGLMCNINYQAPNQNAMIKVNYNGANIKLTEVILESGLNIAINGIAMTNIGGTVNVQNFHAEQISIPIFINFPSGSTAGALLAGLTGGTGCTSLVKRLVGSEPNRITLGTAVRAGCTNTYDNTGSLITSNIYNWVNF